jgi:hypothetical protein
MAEPKALYDYAEVNASAARTFSAKNATPDDIIKIANTIWSKVVSSGIKSDDDAGNDKLFESLHEEYKDFGTSFPLVLRWMVQARQYKPKALKLYLLKHASTELNSREDFLNLQAEYLVMLFREQQVHPTEAAINLYRTQVREFLLKEDKEFVEIQKQVEADLEAAEKKANLERRLELYKHLLSERAKGV